MQDANRSSTQPGEAATGDRSTATRGHGNVRSSSATPFTAPTHASIGRPGRPPVPVRGVPVCCLLEQTRSRNGTRARICCRRRPTHAAASVVRHAPCKCVTVRSKLQLQATMRSCRQSRNHARPELMPEDPVAVHISVPGRRQATHPVTTYTELTRRRTCVRAAPHQRHNHARATPIHVSKRGISIFDIEFEFACLTFLLTINSHLFEI